MNALAAFDDATVRKVEASKYFIITSQKIVDSWIEANFATYFSTSDIIELRYAFGNLPLDGGRYLYHFDTFENAEMVLNRLPAIVVSSGSYLEQLDFRDPVTVNVVLNMTNVVFALLGVGLVLIACDVAGVIMFHAYRGIA